MEKQRALTVIRSEDGMRSSSEHEITGGVKDTGEVRVEYPFVEGWA